MAASGVLVAGGHRGQRILERLLHRRLLQLAGILHLGQPVLGEQRPYLLLVVAAVVLRRQALVGRQVVEGVDKRLGPGAADPVYQHGAGSIEILGRLGDADHHVDAAQEVIGRPLAGDIGELHRRQSR